MNIESDTEFEIKLQDAIARSRNGEVNVAIEELIGLTKTNPNQAAPHLLLAAEFIELGNTPQAEHHFASCLLVAPAFHLARFQFGLFLLTQDRMALSLLIWQPLLEIDERSPFRLFTEGMIHRIQGNKNEAIACIELGIKLNSYNDALNRDLQGIVDSLKSNEVTTTTTGKVNPEPHGSATPNVEEVSDKIEETHILLNNYQQLSQFH